MLPVAAAELALQLAFANRYGYHRDELYFRTAARHPAAGYDDQGPLTPLLGWVSEALFGETPRGLRILSAASILSFMVLSLVFFHVLRQERDGVTDQLSISATLLCGMSILTGTMLICASSQLGFFLALSTLAANAAGLIVVVCIFFRQLGRGMSAINPSQV